MINAIVTAVKKLDSSFIWEKIILNITVLSAEIIMYGCFLYFYWFFVEQGTTAKNNFNIASATFSRGKKKKSRFHLRNIASIGKK